jgi:hypothetical protein
MCLILNQSLLEEHLGYQHLSPRGTPTGQQYGRKMYSTPEIYLIFMVHPSFVALNYRCVKPNEKMILKQTLWALIMK